MQYKVTGSDKKYLIEVGTRTRDFLSLTQVVETDCVRNIDAPYQRYGSEPSVEQSDICSKQNWR